MPAADLSNPEIRLLRYLYFKKHWVGKEQLHLAHLEFGCGLRRGDSEFINGLIKLKLVNEKLASAYKLNAAGAVIYEEKYVRCNL